MFIMLEAKKKTKILSVFSGATMMRRGHPNTNDSFLEQLVHPPGQFLCANDNRQEHPKIFDSITKQFYMDDFIQTFATEGDTIKTISTLVIQPMETTAHIKLSISSTAILSNLMTKVTPTFNQ